MITIRSTVFCTSSHVNGFIYDRKLFFDIPSKMYFHKVIKHLVGNMRTCLYISFQTTGKVDLSISNTIYADFGESEKLV